MTQTIRDASVTSVQVDSAHAESTTDQFQEQYAAVHALQKVVFGKTWPRDFEALIELYIMYIQVECAEVLQCINFKRHKTRKEVDLEALREEVVDLQIYIMALSGVMFTDVHDFLASVDKKIQKNTVRKDWEINQ